MAVATIVSVLVGACQSRTMPIVFPDIKTERVEMTVDDRVIDGGDFFAIIDPVLWSVETNTLDEYERTLRSFSRRQRLFLAVLLYLAEVDNGGHHQFFFNSAGVVWPDAIAGLQELGLPEVIDIAQEAIARMGGSPARARSERWEQLDRLKPDFEDLDNRLYRFEERVDIFEKMLQVARQHRRDFYFRGFVEKPVPVK